MFRFLCAWARPYRFALSLKLRRKLNEQTGRCGFSAILRDKESILFVLTLRHLQISDACHTSHWHTYIVRDISRLCCIPIDPSCLQVRLHSLEHAGMFISGPDGQEMTDLVEVSRHCHSGNIASTRGHVYVLRNRTES